MTKDNSIIEQGVHFDAQKQAKKERVKKSIIQEKYKANRAELLSMAKKACRDFGGQALIDEGFVVVDTKVYDVIRKV